MSQKDFTAPMEIDDETISKIVPTLFTEMNNKFSRTRPSFTNTNTFQENTSTTEDIKKDENTSIQALLQESEQLDAIIPVIGNISSTMDEKISQYLLQTKQTCTSTIKILDTWNNIFSQAGYMKTLSEYANKNSGRSDTVFREDQKTGSRPPKSNAEILHEKMGELEMAKKTLKDLQAAKANPRARAALNRRTPTPGYAAATTASARGKIQKAPIPSTSGSRVKDLKVANMGNGILKKNDKAVNPYRVQTKSTQSRPYVGQSKPRRSLFDR